MPEGSDRDLEFIQFQFEKMFRTFSFFSGINVESLKQSSFIDEIANYYFSSMKILFEDEQQLELQNEFTWKNETWYLHPRELSNSSKMTFGEFIDSKQLIKDMIEMGAGKWEYMLPLCAIYLRKENEPYKEEFLFERSERMALMRELPMDIAMQVGFFLTSSMNMFLTTLKSSHRREQKAVDVMQKSIMTSGVG